MVVDAHDVELLASRTGGGNGRIYSVKITCTDKLPLSSNTTVTVTVPHDQGHQVSQPSATRLAEFATSSARRSEHGRHLRRGPFDSCLETGADDETSGGDPGEKAGVWNPRLFRPQRKRGIPATRHAGIRQATAETPLSTATSACALKHCGRAMAIKNHLGISGGADKVIAGSFNQGV